MSERRYLDVMRGHGTKNDFVLAYDPDGELNVTPALVARMCDRRTGLGGDGFIRVVRAGALDHPFDGVDDPGMWCMDYYNADGSVAQMCGNGIRTFGTFAVHHDVWSASELGNPDGVWVGTRAGVKRLHALSESGWSMDWRVDMGTWEVGGTPGAADTPVFGSDVMVAARGLGAEARPGLRVSTGNPHVVVPLRSLDELHALDLSQTPQLHPAQPGGANVEFMVLGGVSGTTHQGRITMRVHERGAGETLSCGTGACAAAIAARCLAGPGAPQHWQVDVVGGRLGIEVTGDTVTMTGEGVLIATAQWPVG